MQVGDHESATLYATHGYIIALDRKLEITDTPVGASKFEQARGQRPTMDFFFCSLTASQGDGLAIVLSGSGSKCIADQNNCYQALGSHINLQHSNREKLKVEM